MIAGHTRTLRDADPLPPAIRTGRRVGATAECHATLRTPDQLPLQVLQEHAQWTSAGARYFAQLTDQARLLAAAT